MTLNLRIVITFPQPIRRIFYIYSPQWYWCMFRSTSTTSANLIVTCAFAANDREFDDSSSNQHTHMELLHCKYYKVFESKSLPFWFEWIAQLIEYDSRVFLSSRHIVIITRHRFNHSHCSSRTCVRFDLTFFQSNLNHRHYNQMNFGLKSGDGESAMHKRIYGTYYHYMNDRIINN